jgi:hypothetical protein
LNSEQELDAIKSPCLPSPSGSSQGASVFLGFAARSKEVEVISWNKTSHRFDFLVVENYAEGLKPKIALPERQFCMACHQNGGPIFSRQNWNESATFLEDFRNKLKMDPALADLRPGPGGFFDFFVRDANETLQASNVCKKACAGDSACRAQLLLGALLQSRGDSKALKQKFAPLLSGLTAKQWPADEFVYPSDAIPNRDPLKSTEHGGLVERGRIVDLAKFLKACPAGPLQSYQIKTEYEAGIELTFNHTATSFDGSDETTPGLQALYFNYDDPRSKGPASVTRPKVSPIGHQFAGEFIYDHLPACFELDDRSKALAKSLSESKIEEFFTDSIGRRFVSSNWLPSPGRIYTYLRARAENVPIPESFFVERLREDNEGPPVVEAAAHSPVYEKSLPEVFKFYCSECHNEQGIDLGPITPENLGGYIDAEGESLAEKIENGIMPQDLDRYNDREKQWWQEDKKNFLQLVGH